MIETWNIWMLPASATLFELTCSIHLTFNTIHLKLINKSVRQATWKYIILFFKYWSLHDQTILICGLSDLMTLTWWPGDLITRIWGRRGDSDLRMTRSCGPSTDSELLLITRIWGSSSDSERFITRIFGLKASRDLRVTRMCLSRFESDLITRIWGSNMESERFTGLSMFSSSKSGSDLL